MTKKRFEVSSKLGKRLLGELISTHPSVSFSVAAEIVTLSRAQLFADVGMLTENDEEGLFSFENIAMSSPSEHALRHARGACRQRSSRNYNTNSNMQTFTYARN